jgi:SAM-dependent methyltransferase
MINNFKLYAQYYNLIYQNKNYSDEVNYIDNLLLNSTNAKINSILDLGCGTGKHDFLLSEKGYQITGVDISKEMIEIAESTNKPNIEFVLGDIRNIDLNKKFDAVISLFHVASYQTENIDFITYLETAFTHLNTGGLFLFDFWYGPAVISDKPTFRKKEFENESLKITRISNPTLFPNKNVVDVNFDIKIINKTDASIHNIEETHKMRYFFLPEIINFAKQIGFSFQNSFEWMTNQDLSFDSWNGVVILKK